MFSHPGLFDFNGLIEVDIAVTFLSAEYFNEISSCLFSRLPCDILHSGGTLQEVNAADREGGLLLSLLL